MKEKMISKIILVLIMMVVLLAMPMNIFATSDAQDLINDYDFFEDQTTELQPEQPQEPTTPEVTTPEPTTPKKEETLPDAGIAEDTMMIVTVIALGVIAVFANKKVKEYNNI